jgi:hypothetical protein
MSLPTAYLMSVKNLRDIFAAMQKAAVPETFTYEFMKQLGFASSGDRPLIPVMKAIGFLDASGKPTRLYRDYKDPSIAGDALARGLRDGYKDLFAVDTQANERSASELNGLFARLSDKGGSVTQKMATTFKALAELADFSGAILPAETEATSPVSEGQTVEVQPNGVGVLTLRHDIHVHLPLSTDVGVYDAIFKSLKANLL